MSFGAKQNQSINASKQYLSVSVVSAVHNVLSHHLKVVLGLLEPCGAPTHHKGQGACFGAPNSTRHRGINSHQVVLHSSLHDKRTIQFNVF